MTIRHLRVFISVVDSGSMTGAAKKLFVSQPSVSQTISELENHYNIKLFERLSRKLYITEEGEKFLSYARYIISSFDEMEENMKQSLESSLLKVGASVTIGTYILSPLSEKFLKSNPNISLEAIVDNTRIIEDMVLKSKIDFGLVEGPIHSEYIICKPFMSDELILICGNKHPFKEKQQITIEDLAKAHLIVRENGSGTRELFEKIMLAQGHKLNIKWVCNNSETIKNAVISNIGVSIVSKMTVDSELKNKKLFHIKIDNTEFKREFNIIYHKNKYISEPIRKFWKMVID